jgi:hypothetical protein
MILEETDYVKVIQSRLIVSDKCKLFSALSL